MRWCLFVLIMFACHCPYWPYFFYFTWKILILFVIAFSNISSKRDAHSIILRIKNQVGLVICSYLYIFKFVKFLYKFILNAFYARRYKVSDIFLSCHNLRQNLQALMILSVLCTSYFQYQFFSQKYSESVIQKWSVKMAFLKTSQNSQENTCVDVSFLIKLQAWGLQLY